ncbi:uncharacterized protein LOC125141425 [Tachysurus ichikawai]
MQENLWQQLTGEAPTSTSRSSQRFIMADGKVHQAVEKRTVSYKWHEKECRVDTYIIKDAHLAFPLKAGLDFLTATGAILEVGQHRYALSTEKGYTYHLPAIQGHYRAKHHDRPYSHCSNSCTEPVLCLTSHIDPPSTYSPASCC